MEYKAPVCSRCGATLTKLVSEDMYCEYCRTIYYKEHTVSQEVYNSAYVLEPSNNCIIIGGVLQKYVGNEQVIRIPDGVMAVAPEACKGNILLQKVIFPDSLVELGERAFADCVNLCEMINYEGIQIYKSECLMGTAIKSLTVGPAVTQLADGCFSCMPQLLEVVYEPQKDLKLKRTFAKCDKLGRVVMSKNYFFPSFRSFLEVNNNPGNKRPTFYDAFHLTPYYTVTREHYLDLYGQGICPDCGGKIKKGLFHSKCTSCGIDMKN